MTTGERMIEAPGDLRRVVTLVALALVACLVYLAVEAYLLDGEMGFSLDDSWIHLQFARNLALGQGLSYNPGELVAASTSPLWTALLSALFLLPGDIVLWVKTLGIFCYLVLAWATFVLGKEIGLSGGMATFATILTIFSSWLVWSALSGMEIVLFTLLGVFGVVLHLRERPRREAVPFSLFVIGLSVLVRPEGLLLLALALVDRVLAFDCGAGGELSVRITRLRSSAFGAGLAALSIVPVALSQWAISGSMLPTTFAAKSTGGTRLLPSIESLKMIFSLFVDAQPVLAFAAFAGVLMTLQRLGKDNDVGLLPAGWLLGLPLAYSVLQGGGSGAAVLGNFGRYHFPVLPFVMVLGMVGVEQVAVTLGRAVRIGQVRIPVRSVLACMVALPTLVGFAYGASRHAQTVMNVQDSDVRIAHWLAERLPPEALLAVNDIGALKFFLPNHVVDMAAIIDPELRGYIEEAQEQGADWHYGVLRLLRERQPDYLVIFPGWYPRLTELDSGFQVRYVLNIPNNITMGGNEIAVFSTPWTRHPLREP